MMCLQACRGEGGKLGWVLTACPPATRLPPVAHLPLALLPPLLLPHVPVPPASSPLLLLLLLLPLRVLGEGSR